MNSINAYPESKAVKTWEQDGIGYAIVLNPHLNHYCGYCRFKARPVKEQGHSGILTYAPVHGGITYAKQDEHGMVYGFDCGHVDDEKRPELRDLDWLSGECIAMATAIKEAVAFEDQYLLASDNTGKANVLDAYHERLKSLGITFNLTDNFGAMIAAIFGSL